MGVIEFPIFYGEDPERWVSWMDAYFSAEGFSDFEKMQFAYGFIEEDALTWYCDEISQSVFSSWEELKLRLFQRFGKKKQLEKPTFHDRLEQLSRVLDRLEQRWIEEDDGRKQQEEDTLVPEDSIQIVNHVEGSLKNNDSILPEEKDDLSSWRHQMITQEKDKPHTQMTEIPVSLFDGENAKHGDCRVEQYFERGKVTEEDFLGFHNRKGKEMDQQEEEKQIEIEMDKYARQVFEKMTQGRKTKNRKRKKRKFIKFRRSKYRNGKLNSVILGIPRENICGSQRKSSLVRCKGVSCYLLNIRQVLDKSRLLRFRKKMKGRTKTSEYEKTSVEYSHELGNAKLPVEDKTAKKKLMKWKKRELECFLGNHIAFPCDTKLELEMIKNNLSGWSKKNLSYEDAYQRFEQLRLQKGTTMLNRSCKMRTVRRSQRFKSFSHVANLSTDKMTEMTSVLVIIPKKKKTKTKKRRVVLFSEQNNQVHQVTVERLKTEVRISKVTMISRRVKRYGFRHKHRKRKMPIKVFRKKWLSSIRSKTKTENGMNLCCHQVLDNQLLQKNRKDTKEWTRFRRQKKRMRFQYKQKKDVRLLPFYERGINKQVVTAMRKRKRLQRSDVKLEGDDFYPNIAAEMEVPVKQKQVVPFALTTTSGWTYEFRLAAVNRGRDVWFTWMCVLDDYLSICNEIDKEQNLLASIAYSVEVKPGELKMFIAEDVPKQINIMPCSVSPLTKKNKCNVMEEILKSKGGEIPGKYRVLQDHKQRNEASHGYFLVKPSAGASGIGSRRQHRDCLHSLNQKRSTNSELIIYGF